MRSYLLLLLAAAAVTHLLVPPVRKLALRWRVVAAVRERDVHTEPTPRLGGLAMLGGVCFALLLASRLDLTQRVFTSSSAGRGLLIGAVLVAVLGALDDRFSLDAVTKIVGQVFIAAVVAANGVQLLWLPLGGVVVLDPATSTGLTVLVIVLLMNAVNFIDGLDGLAAGISLIAGIAFLAYAYLLSVEIGFSRATLPSVVSATLAGCAGGFLIHNVSRARIFMGDTGSMLLGLLMATAAVTLTGYVDPGALDGTGALVPAFLPLILPLAVMAVPVLDLVLAVLRRAVAGRDPFAPDKKHLHHRLLDLGHSHRRAAGLMYAWTALLAFATVALAFLPAVVVAPVATVALAVLVAVVFRGRRGAADRSP